MSAHLNKLDEVRTSNGYFRNYYKFLKACCGLTELIVHTCVWGSGDMLRIEDQTAHFTGTVRKLFVCEETFAAPHIILVPIKGKELFLRIKLVLL